MKRVPSVVTLQGLMEPGQDDSPGKVLCSPNRAGGRGEVDWQQHRMPVPGGPEVPQEEPVPSSGGVTPSALSSCL